MQTAMTWAKWLVARGASIAISLTTSSGRCKPASTLSLAITSSLRHLLTIFIYNIIYS